jgi:hypothetical protein
MTTVSIVATPEITATFTSPTTIAVTAATPSTVSVSVAPSGIADADADDGIYGRMNNAWKDIIIISATEPATMNSKLIWVDTA